MIRANISTKNRKIVKLYEREPIKTVNGEYEIIPDGEHKFKIYRTNYSETYDKIYFLLEKDEDTLYSYTPSNQLQPELLELYEAQELSDAVYIIIYKKTYPDSIEIAIDFEKEEKEITVKDNSNIDDIIKELDK
jgi:hypothetical protein